MLVLYLTPETAAAHEPLIWQHLRRREDVRVLCLNHRPEAYVARSCRRLENPYDDVDAYVLDRDSRPRRRPGGDAAPATAPSRVRLVRSSV